MCMYIMIVVCAAAGNLAREAGGQRELWEGSGHGEGERVDIKKRKRKQKEGGRCREVERRDEEEKVWQGRAKQRDGKERYVCMCLCMFVYDSICLYMLVYAFGNICIRCICMYIIVYVRTYSRMIAHACELLRFF